MKNYNILIIISLFTLISSCFKEDDIIENHTEGNVQSATIVMGNDYQNQVYYSLKNTQFVKSNIRTDYDLAFSSDSNDFNIYLNSAKIMYAGNSNSTDFSSVNSDNGIEMKFDKSDGNPDSLALAGWYKTSGDSIISNNYVYVIDRGNDLNYMPIGKVKIQLDYVNNEYIIRYAKLDGSSPKTVSIKKDSDYNTVFFSFDNGKVDIAPPKNQWSLQFTTYTTLLYTSDGQSQPYGVAGVILNKNKCVAALDSLNDFQSIELNDTANYQFSSKLDFIGYDWKFYDFENGIYSIRPNQVFIIRDHHGYYYKLRFTDFYGETGEKGVPQFEYVRL